jgi:hypothetical protein
MRRGSIRTRRPRHSAHGALYWRFVMWPVLLSSRITQWRHGPGDRRSPLDHGSPAPGTRLSGHHSGDAAIRARNHVAVPAARQRLALGGGQREAGVGVLPGLLLRASEQTSCAAAQSVTTEMRLTRPYEEVVTIAQAAVAAGSSCPRCCPWERLCEFLAPMRTKGAIAATPLQMRTAFQCCCRWRGERALFRPSTSSRRWIRSGFTNSPREWHLVSLLRPHDRLDALDQADGQTSRPLDVGRDADSAGQPRDCRPELLALGFHCGQVFSITLGKWLHARPIGISRTVGDTYFENAAARRRERPTDPRAIAPVEYPWRASACTSMKLPSLSSKEAG